VAVDESHPRTSAADEAVAVAADLAPVAGLVAYLVAFGWTVDTVRFAAAGLPAAAGVSPLGARQLLGDGVREALFAIGVLAVGCAVAYLTASRRWDVHGQDWHDLIQKGGVTRARAGSSAAEHARRRLRHESRKATRAAAHATLARRLKCMPLARLAERHRRRAARRADALRPLALRPRALDQAPEPLRTAPLGDGAVRIVAGFNVGIASLLFAAAVGRGVGAAIPHVRWVGLIAGAVAFLAAREGLTLVRPLFIHPRMHGLLWVLVGAGTLFAAAPIGVLVLTGVALATAGRAVARVSAPTSVRAWLRSPLPWLLLTVSLLLAVADSAMPPVGLPAATLVTSDGTVSGGRIAETGDAVYMATCVGLADATSADVRLSVVPRRSIRSERLGGPADYLDSGARPSIADLLFGALGTGGSVPTLFDLPLRARQPTCDGALRAEGYRLGAPAPTLGADVIAGPSPGLARAHDGEAPIAQTSPAEIAVLARRYQPTLLVSAVDRNWPVSVQAVLAERGPQGQPACLIRAQSPRRACSPTAEDLTGDAQRSDYLQLPVALGSNRSPDGQFDAFLRGQYESPGPRRHWLLDPTTLDPWYTAQLYFYFAGPLSARASRELPVDPNLPPGLPAMEYWFYYPYNYYPLVTDSDLMAGAPLAGDHFNVDLHQGDWEHVDVLLNPVTLQPEWLYMARHSSEGQFVPWSSPRLRFDGSTHPIVQAAYGGHPSYLPGCGLRSRPATNDLSSDVLACGNGRFAFRAADTPLVDLARTPWACWPGHFGEARTGLEVRNAGRPETLLDSATRFVFVAGPSSPLRQAENSGACRDGTTSALAPELGATRGSPPRSTGRRRAG
jgi:hypothetical protein